MCKAVARRSFVRLMSVDGWHSYGKASKVVMKRVRLLMVVAQYRASMCGVLQAQAMG